MLGAAGRRAQSSPPLPSGALRGLCAWLDGLPLSRPKRHLARDFSDGVMLAEIVKHFYPRLVDLHNYVPTCNTDQKLSNWSVLNRKVFHKLRLWVSETEIQKVVANTPGAIEPILLALREKVKDGAVQQAPPPTADPGPSSADANSPQAQLTTPAHTGLQGPTVPSGVKTLPSQRTPERTGHFRTQPMGPWSTWIPGCNSYWRKRSRPWSCCRRWSRWTGCCLPDMCVLLKILQMKVVRLERLLKLKEQQIGELTRTGTSPSDREWARRKSPLRGPGPTPPKATRP